MRRAREHHVKHAGSILQPCEVIDMRWIAIWMMLGCGSGRSPSTDVDADSPTDVVDSVDSTSVDGPIAPVTCTDPGSTWSLAVTRDGTVDEGADAHAALAPDCSTVLSIADPIAAVKFGDMVLSGSYLARISSDGTIAPELVPSPNIPTPYGMTLAVDAQNRPVVVWGAFFGVLVVAYDAQLGVRWQFPIGMGVAFGFDVGASGNVAVQDHDAGGTYSKLRYLASSGVERWNRDADIRHLRVLANNDVVAYQVVAGGPRRVVYAAADGAILDDRTTSMPSTITADGDGLLAGAAETTGVFLERHDPDGGVVWHVDVEGNASPDLAVTPDGVITALIRGPMANES